MNRKIGFLFVCLILILVACENRSTNSIRISKESATETMIDADQSLQSDGTVIAYVPKSLDNPVFLETKEEAERESLNLDVKIEWVAPMVANSKGQEQIFEALIQRNVDGIIISVIDTERMTSLINKAVSKGIKVATFDSDAPSSNRAFYVGTDNYKLGQASGEALLKTVKEKNMDKHPLELMVMTGTKESENLEQRIQGFKDATASLDIHIVDVIESYDDINIASELLENYVKENPDFDLFFSTGGWPFFAPPDGMLAYKKWKANGGIAVSVDTFYPIVSAANEGLVDALVGQNFQEMGRLSLKYMYQLINGEDLDKQKFYTQMEYGNPDNFDELLKNKNPWEIK
ncbi:substrate-binding domain-containing protein [Aquibacillus albus]|uniref:Ribose transport system substrate-binding protein n=1 Tax=Aquibacillus albus TaxID=1168171 RepID=A0ABS2N4J3_9BACI|nr:substrate-binding domain-containing protein [Aquibacillus albus]MBM7573031.1 ribose transport system substrate-binding protein [Aquibacillus albus]